MTPQPPAGWYQDPQNSSQMRYWDGVAWAGQTTQSDPFAAPLSQPPSPGIGTFDAGTKRSSGLSTGGVIGIVASAIFAVAALVGAVTVLAVMTSDGDNFAFNSPPSASATPIEAAEPLESDQATTGAFDQDSLPFELEKGQETTTWMMRYDAGSITVPADARDVTQSAIARIKGDSSYIAGAWTFDGLSWSATEAYLYTETWTYDAEPFETLEETIDQYYVEYYKDYGLDTTEVTVSTNAQGYEVATFDAHGVDDQLTITGIGVPVRHTVVLVRDGYEEAVFIFYRFAVRDETAVTKWDSELQASIDSFRFWADIE